MNSASLKVYIINVAERISIDMNATAKQTVYLLFDLVTSITAVIKKRKNMVRIILFTSFFQYSTKIFLKQELNFFGLGYENIKNPQKTYDIAGCAFFNPARAEKKSTLISHKAVLKCN